MDEFALMAEMTRRSKTALTATSVLLAAATAYLIVAVGVGAEQATAGPMPIDATKYAMPDAIKARLADIQFASKQPVEAIAPDIAVGIAMNNYNTESSISVTANAFLSSSTRSGSPRRLGLIGLACAAAVFACTGMISREQAISLAEAHTSDSLVPVTLVSAQSGQLSDFVETSGMEAEEAARPVWAVVFIGQFQGEGVAPFPPPLVPRKTVVLDRSTGEFIAAQLSG